MIFLKTVNNRLLYFAYNGLFTVIDTIDFSISISTYTVDTLHIGDDVSWLYVGDKSKYIIVASNGNEMVQGILYVISNLLPISNLIWKK